MENVSTGPDGCRERRLSDCAPPSSGPGHALAAPASLDGVSSFMGMRWDDPADGSPGHPARADQRRGLLSGVVTYALVDYCMGSTLWAQTTEQERIATISIAINYIQTATEGEIVCHTSSTAAIAPRR